MMFVIKNPKDNIINLTRKIGYFFIGSSFIRPLERSGYPRFHFYIKESNNEIIFNLHLDQKRPVYKNGPAHSGEYESEAVKTESERIKQILK